MRILIINTWYYPNMMGGAEHSVKILAENLAKNGHEVAIFCIDNKEKGVCKEVINNVQIYRSSSCKYKLYEAYAHSLNIIQKIYNKYLEIYNKSIINNFTSVIDEFQPDIVHGNCIAGISLSIIQKLDSRNIPIVQTMRDYWMLSPKATLKEEGNIFYKTFLGIYRKYCIRKTSTVLAVTAPSQFTLNAFLNEGFFKDSILKLPVANCVETDINAVAKIISEKEKKNDKDIRFLYVGWISKIKGVDELVDAFKSINNENISLTLCGDGELKGYILKKIKNDSRIKYMGKLKSEQLMEVYKKSDVLIIPSLWEEPFGRVVIEGNMNGLPVIASNKGGIPEILKVMNSGISYCAENTEELKNCIIKMSNRNNIKTFYPNILHNINNFFVNKQIESYENVYKYVVLNSKKIEVHNEVGDTQKKIG